MDVKITEVSDNTVELTLENEDFSIADILHQELLKNPKVIFAGIAPSHPLIKKHVITIQIAKNVKLISVVSTGGEAAAKTAAKILEAVDKALEDKSEVK